MLTPSSSCNDTPLGVSLIRLLVGLLVCVGLFFVSPHNVAANPGQFGETGLLSQPTAGTLNEGNICVGIWANCSDGVENGSGNGGDSMIVPTTITMGLGTFMEVYGSYPNVLFNGDEDVSGRGFANAGFKFRVYGERSDPFRVGFDIHARRSVSDVPALDGLTDYVGRFIASYKKKAFGVHANIGYASNDSPSSSLMMPKYDDQVLIGGGVEYFPINRLRLIAELNYGTEKIDGQDDIGDAMVGFQYFLTPHLTMNMGAGVGFSDGSPDWRALFGFSTCQGVGFFNRPVPKLIDPDEIVDEEPAEPVKVVKIKTLTPLLPKATALESPVSHLEVPLKGPKKDVTIDPSDRLKMPEIERLDVPAVSPIGGDGDDENAYLRENPFEASVLRVFRFPDFSFAFNQFDLSSEGRKSLDLVAEEIRQQDGDFILSVEGHTDSVGSNSYNQKLSYRRAMSAATHFVTRNGVDPNLIFVKGRGEDNPISDNATEEGRAKNRRVELLILIPKAENVEAVSSDTPVEESEEAVAEPASQSEPDALVVPEEEIIEEEVQDVDVAPAEESTNVEDAPVDNSNESPGPVPNDGTVSAEADVPVTGAVTGEEVIPAKSKISVLLPAAEKPIGEDDVKDVVDPIPEAVDETTDEPPTSVIEDAAEETDEKAATVIEVEAVEQPVAPASGKIALLIPFADEPANDVAGSDEVVDEPSAPSSENQAQESSEEASK